MKDTEMPKAYDSGATEDAIYQLWLDSGYFNPDNLPNLDKRTESFAIVLPPPNVTGTLHMGHAVMLAIEDAMTRYARMSGKRTLWLPGTDHAAVATESKVERMLIDNEGMKKPKEELGREAFLGRVKQFAQESHDTIVNQMKKMGASVDWSREAYTLDDKRNFAVRTAFKRMYDDGLIYRGYRVINWSVAGQSTCSDDELVYIDRPAKLYTFKYSKELPITIATTRPETKLGDTAIAVHPEGQWKKYIGQEFTVDNFGQDGHKLRLKVIGSTDVADDFGTGALGVTPAHSMVDFDMYSKEKAAGNDIGLIQVIGEDGKIMPAAGSEYVGLNVEEARAKVVAWLNDQGLLEGEEDVTQSAGTSDRFKDVVEPLPKTQWFIDVNKEFEKNGKQTTLKKLMQNAVRGGDVEILPERFSKTYFHWIDNLRDWNISRQIWFGHQIPVWYCQEGESGVCTEDCKPQVAVEKPATCPGCGTENLTQDPDTLDTWFSSGLWTFSTLGWPDEDAVDFKTFHPTQVLETGYDILFFWVARMILMSTYLVDEVPFKTVYLHGLVRDGEGRKMSKSLGNVLDPLDMIAANGADATRLSLMIGSSPGNDIKLNEEKVGSYRNFTNKLWNIARFVFMSVDNVELVETVEAETLADRWILGRLSEVIEKTTKHFEKYELSLAGELLRDFTWNEFADWYVEIAKTQPSENTNKILLHVLQNVLKLWHPMMPFVTEEIYKKFNSDLLIVADWPGSIVGVGSAHPDRQTRSLQDEDRDAFKLLQEIVAAIRNIRATYKVPHKQKIDVLILGPESLESESDVLVKLANIGNLNIDANAEKPEQAASAILSSAQVYVPLSGIVDSEEEKERLNKELKEATAYVANLEGRLSNKEYVSNAPDAVVQSTKDELTKAQGRVEILKEEINNL